MRPRLFAPLFLVAAACSSGAFDVANSSEGAVDSAVVPNDATTDDTSVVADDTRVPTDDTASSPDTKPAADAISKDAADADAATDPADATCKLHQVYSSKQPVCNVCAQDHCCAQVNACFDDTRCNDDYIDCILVCALEKPDSGPTADARVAIDACLAECAKSYPEGKKLYDVAISCVEKACGADCI